MKDPLKPELQVLMKLGSIVVHTDEFFSSDGHGFDKTVLEGLLQDQQVKDWIIAMGPMLPKKRRL